MCCFNIVSLYSSLVAPHKITSSDNRGQGDVDMTKNYNVFKATSLCTVILHAQLYIAYCPGLHSKTSIY